MSRIQANVAVVGAGDWGKNLLRILADRANVPVVCHDGNPETAAYLDDQYPAIDRVTDYATVLTDDRVDAVVLATPNPTHAPFARRALAADTHVFVEKPIATTGEAAAEVAQVAADSEAICFAGYLFCYHPLIEALRKIHHVDPISHLRATWHKTGSFGPDLRHQLLCHHVALAELLFGPEPSEWRTGGERPPGAPNERPAAGDTGTVPEVRTVARSGRPGHVDRLAVTLTYGQKVYSATVDRLSPVTSHAIVAHTEDGEVLAWEDERLSRLVDGNFRTITERSREPLAVELETFLECVEDGRNPPTDARFALRVARVLDAVDADGR